MGCSVHPSALWHRFSDAKPEWDILYIECQSEKCGWVMSSKSKPNLFQVDVYLLISGLSLEEAELKPVKQGPL
jgi:hypothetical protein